MIGIWKPKKLWQWSNAIIDIGFTAVICVILHSKVSKTQNHLTDLVLQKVRCVVIWLTRPWNQPADLNRAPIATSSFELDHGWLYGHSQTNHHPITSVDQVGSVLDMPYHLYHPWRRSVPRFLSPSLFLCLPIYDIPAFSFKFYPTLFESFHWLMKTLEQFVFSIGSTLMHGFTRCYQSNSKLSPLHSQQIRQVNMSMWTLHLRVSVFSVPSHPIAHSQKVWHKTQEREIATRLTTLFRRGYK